MTRKFKPEVMMAGRGGWCEWVHPKDTAYRASCCDCGLVHDMQFSLDAENKLIFRARRNVKVTREWRKKTGKTA